MIVKLHQILNSKVTYDNVISENMKIKYTGKAKTVPSADWCKARKRKNKKKKSGQGYENISRSSSQIKTKGVVS